MIAKIEKDGNGKVNYPLLSDPGHKTIDEYGLLDERYIGRRIEGVPQTAIYILDKERKIVWANVSQDYSSRPSIQTLRTEIDKFKAMNSSKEKMEKKGHHKKEKGSDKMKKMKKGDSDDQ